MSKLHPDRVEMGSMSQTTRDNLSSPPAGTIIYNTTSKKGQMYDGTAWKDMTSAGIADAAGELQHQLLVEKQ